MKDLQYTHKKYLKRLDKIECTAYEKLQPIFISAGTAQTHGGSNCLKIPWNINNGNQNIYWKKTYFDKDHYDKDKKEIYSLKIKIGKIIKLEKTSITKNWFIYMLLCYFINKLIYANMFCTLPDELNEQLIDFQMDLNVKICNITRDVIIKRKS